MNWIKKLPRFWTKAWQPWELESSFASFRFAKDALVAKRVRSFQLCQNGKPLRKQATSLSRFGDSHGLVAGNRKKATKSQFHPMKPNHFASKDEPRS